MGLLSDDAKPIYQDRPSTLRGEDLPSVMEDDRWLSKTGPGMLTSIDANHMIFPFQAHLDQAHIVLFLEWPQRQSRTEDGRCFDTDKHRKTRRLVFVRLVDQSKGPATEHLAFDQPQLRRRRPVWEEPPSPSHDVGHN